MQDILKTFFLTREDIQKALVRNDLKYCYDVLETLVKQNSNNIPNALVSAFTLILIESGIDPLMHLNKVYPYMYKQIDYIDEAIIPSNIKSIGDWAFEDCAEMTSVELTNGLEKIGEYAFYECERLKSITIPDSVTEIGENAFEYCTHLKSVTIGSGVTSIGYGTFSECPALKNITIPEGVTSIGDYAFSDCTGLKTVKIPDSVTIIGKEIFYRCPKISDVTIPKRFMSYLNDIFGEHQLEINFTFI